MITHISTVAVYVDDQQKSLDFWIEKVGFKPAILRSKTRSFVTNVVIKGR